MIIDSVSKNIIQLALFVDKAHPGFVSELWVDKDLKKQLPASILSEQDIDNVIDDTKKLISELKDQRRQHYLSEILDSLDYQRTALDQPEIPYSQFSRHAFGFEIPRVTEPEIFLIQDTIHQLEKKIGLSRREVFQKHTIEKDALVSFFQDQIVDARSLLPTFITAFPDKGFAIKLVSNKPWSAFNSHTAPFTSQLSINTDVHLSGTELYRLAFHEAYGGHHSELCQKDQLLLGGRGEHGLVITFSPQTFISEAIAEGIFSIFQNKKDDPEYQLTWQYDRLTFALQNSATFLFLDDHQTRDQIDSEFKQYAISEVTRKNILDFSTDPLFCRYSPVYFTAYNFFQKLYQGTTRKEDLLRVLFTQPCTPSLLLTEFGNGSLPTQG